MRMRERVCIVNIILTSCRINSHGVIIITLAEWTDNYHQSVVSETEIAESC